MGEPFVGASGQLLRSALTAANYDLSTVRFFNTVACRPTDHHGDNRTPTAEEAANCVVHVRQDIEQCRPKLILLVGKTALATLFPELAKQSMATLRGQVLDWRGIPVRVTWHPSFVLRSGGDTSPSYGGWLADIKGAHGHFEARAQRAFDLYPSERIDDFLPRFWGVDVLGFDYEANMLNPYSVDFRCGGLGLASGDDAAYLSFTDFMHPDGVVTPEARDKIAAFFRHHQQRGTRMVVFNLKYEVPVTLNVFGVELADVVDTMQYARTINYMGGLKDTSRVVLGTDVWTGDLSAWLSAWEMMLTCLTRLKSGPREEELILAERGPGAVIAHIRRMKKRGNRELKLHNALITLLKLIDHTVGLNEQSDHALRTWVRRKLDADDISARYTEVPVQIVGKYCCLDSLNTLRLQAALEQEIRAKGIDKAAGYYNEHAYLGFELELSGARWDENLACKLDALYEQHMIDSLKALLKLPHVAQLLNLSQQDLLTINASTDVDQLKEWYNPLSNTAESRQKFAAMVTSPRLRFALAIRQVQILLQEDATKAAKQYPTLTTVCHKLAAPGVDRGSFIDVMRNGLQDLQREGTLTRDELNLLCEYANWSPDTAATGMVERIYDAWHTTVGVDPDDRTQWDPEMYALHYFRMFKKTEKSRGTYINGEPGRGSVYKVKTADIEQRVVPRHENYLELPPAGRILGPDEMWLYHPDYNCNAAVTKRWKSRNHSIPAQSELHNLYISRFPNGLNVHFDASQVEIRVLAAVAQDPGLLEALLAGKDIHRLVASRVFGVPEKEVTEAQRRVSKRASFAILYAKTQENFAIEFMHKDMAATKHLFGVIFGMFPKLEDYIAESHKMVMQTGEVPTIWGDTIRIEFDPDLPRSVNEAKRQAQNYRIQSSASGIMGVCNSRIVRWLNEHRYRTRMWKFTHDSGDADTPIDETIPVIEAIPPMAEKLPMELWSIPTKIDIELGVNCGQMVKLKDTKVTAAAGGNQLVAKFKGTQEALDGVLETFRRGGANVNHTMTGSEDVYISYEELWMQKRAYSANIGSTERMIEGALEIAMAARERLREAA